MHLQKYEKKQYRNPRDKYFLSPHPSTPRLPPRMRLPKSGLKTDQIRIKVFCTFTWVISDKSLIRIWVEFGKKMVPGKQGVDRAKKRQKNCRKC